MPVTHLMSAQVSPLALIIPRPQISSVIPHLPTSSFISSALHTPSPSPVASHIFISPPAPNRTSTDSWNSSNYDFDDPNVQWKEEEVRLLGRTLDALPAHLITPFNGSIPPPNLLDKISRGIIAAKGPNDWPHSVTATRAKLLELACERAQEERRRSFIDGDFIFLSGKEYHATMTGDLNKGVGRKDGNSDPADVLQPTTNTPARRRPPLHRQSSMDFMMDAKADRKESISCLSHHLQRHKHTFHHPYLRPAHLRATEHSFSPSTPSSSTLNTTRQSHIRKSTASSNSNSTFGSPVAVPLRPSSLRRLSTSTMASSCDMRMDVGAENVLKTPEFRRSGGYEEGATVGVKVKKTPAHDLRTSSPRTPSVKKVKTPTITKVKTKLPALSVSSPPKTPQSKPPVLPTTTIKVATSIKQPKFRKGHMPSLSIVSSDEEENTRSKRAKKSHKSHTMEPSWLHIASSDARQPILASLQITDPIHKVKPHEPNELRRSAASGSKTSSSPSDEFSTASIETEATSVSLSIPAAPPKRKPSVQVQKKETKSKHARSNLTRNPSMFGAELPCPQATPAPPSRIPLSSPMYTASPSSPSPSTPSTPPLSRPRTLRHAARRISFGSLANARAASPTQPGEGSALALGSAFQLA